MTERVEQRICIRFCIKLEHSSMESIRIIQKVIGMGNWWLVALSRQCVHLCITSHAADFSQNIKSPRWLSPLQLRFGTLKLLAFPKVNITFQREELSEHQWDSGKYNEVADSDWVNYVRSQGAYLEGDWGIILCTMFLVSSSINVSIYYNTWLDTFWTDYIYVYIYIHTRCFVGKQDGFLCY